MRPSLLLFALILISPVAKYVSAEQLPLTLKESIRMAVEKNLDVRAELYNPAQFEAEINRNRSIYDPQLSLLTEYTDSTISPVGSVTSGNTTESQSFLVNSSLSRLLWTGASASINFNNSYTGSNSSQSMPNYWQTGLGASISQPLLKNAGRDATEIAINVSRLSKFASLERFN
ncbi:MAG: TolC family protein, partial [Pseudomonadota bacterium]